MNHCPHSLDFPKNVLVSGPFRFRCTVCDQQLTRDHPLTKLPFAVLFFDRIGIAFIVLVVVLFPFLPVAVLVFSILVLSLYLWDTGKNPLRTVTQDATDEETKNNKIALAALVILFLLCLASIYFKI